MTGNKEWIVICPHCNEYLIINELNCCIFRHGILKDTGEQMNPHASKQECDDFKKNNLIFGCGKPFQITFHAENMIVEICDYI